MRDLNGVNLDAHVSEVNLILPGRDVQVPQTEILKGVREKVVEPIW
jgi:hypothetical protein